MILSKRHLMRKRVGLIDSARTSAAGDTITFPAATAGDIGVLFCSTGGQSSSGWTAIESNTLGTTLVKTMSGGETSVTVSSTNNHLQISFWRGYGLPTTTNSADFYVNNQGTGPNPPVSPITVVESDIVLIAGYANYNSASISSNMPSGYTELEFFNESTTTTSVMGTGYATGLTGTPNPGQFQWGCDIAATMVGTTVILERA